MALWMSFCDQVEVVPAAYTKTSIVQNVCAVLEQAGMSAILLKKVSVP